MQTNSIAGGADLGRDPVGPLLRKLALPAILAQVVNLLYNLVDRMYIGPYRGDRSRCLTGVGVCMPVYYGHFGLCRRWPAWAARRALPS